MINEPEWLSKMAFAISLCEEFAKRVVVNHNGHIIVLLHQKWLYELQARLRECGWEMLMVGPVERAPCFRIVVVTPLVDRANKA